MTTLLFTVHGSHLYGLATPASDRDFYRVVDKLGSRKLRNAQQRISGDDDTLTISLTDFMLDADEGNPKALEAMFSPLSEGPLLALAQSYHVNASAMRRHYAHVVRNFAYRSLTEESLRESLAPLLTGGKTFRSYGKYCPQGYATKYRRHSVRLLINLDTALRTGRFNSQLTSKERATVWEISHLPAPEFTQYIIDRL